MRRGSQPPSGPAGDPARWIGWRAERLRMAGFPPALARRLARDSRIDLHALLELVDRGCRPHLAARIVAPLDWEPERPRARGPSVTSVWREAPLPGVVDRQSQGIARLSSLRSSGSEREEASARLHGLMVRADKTLHDAPRKLHDVIELEIDG
jgi:hypothetical protein